MIWLHNHIGGGRDHLRWDVDVLVREGKSWEPASVDFSKRVASIREARPLVEEYIAKGYGPFEFVVNARIYPLETDEDWMQAILMYDGDTAYKI